MFNMYFNVCVYSQSELHVLVHLPSVVCILYCYRSYDIQPQYLVIHCRRDGYTDHLNNPTHGYAAMNSFTQYIFL